MEIPLNSDDSFQNSFELITCNCRAFRTAFQLYSQKDRKTGEQESKKQFCPKALAKFEMGTVLNDSDDWRGIDEILLQKLTSKEAQSDHHQHIQIHNYHLKIHSVQIQLLNSSALMIDRL
jgi:hypothetical protein